MASSEGSNELFFELKASLIEDLTSTCVIEDAVQTSIYEEYGQMGIEKEVNIEYVVTQVMETIKPIINKYIMQNKAVLCALGVRLASLSEDAFDKANELDV